MSKTLTKTDELWENWMKPYVPEPKPEPLTKTEQLWDELAELDGEINRRENRGNDEQSNLWKIALAYFCQYEIEDEYRWLQNYIMDARSQSEGVKQ